MMRSPRPLHLAGVAIAMLVPTVASAEPSVAGYPGSVSVVAGETLRFHLSATPETGPIELRIARIGREVEEAARIGDVAAGHHAMPENASSHGCGWPAAAEIKVPASWRSGYYEVVPWWRDPASGEAASGQRMRFIVRAADPGKDGAILMHLTTNTENAYGNAGGYSLYAYNGKDGVQGHRVSFERPMAGFAHTWELPFIRWAEAHGYHLEYCANLDLEMHPELLDRYRLVVSVGHDEYWSKGMRDSLEAFLAKGGNAAFFTGNTCCWQVRPEDGGKALVSWKQRPDLDPLFEEPDRHGELSTLWSHHLVKRPETQLLGVGFLFGGYHRSHGQHLDGSGAFTVHRPDHWLFEGTGLKRGDAFGGAHTIVGYECDGCELEWRDGLPFPTGNDGTPADATVVATAVATWHPDDCEWYERWEKGRQGNACLTVREPPDRMGGIVFAAGTTDWSHGLGGGDPIVARITRNVLDRLSGFDAKAPRNASTSRAMIVPRVGFVVEEVAAEPLVRDPVAFDWDDHGRLWVAEMGDYPMSETGGRLVRLTDDDGDGRFDRREEMLDDVGFPSGVMTWRDGVLVTAAPEIFFAADRDGDGRAEVRETLFTGFREGNQQHRVNGPRLMLDGSVSIANGDSGGDVRSMKTGESMDLRGRDLRIEPDTGAMSLLTGQTQFGRNRDDWGNWFGCNNPNPGWQFVFEERYLAGTRLSSNPMLRHDLTSAREVFPISLPLLHSIDIAEPAPGRPGRFTAACGLHIFRDDHWGEAFAGDAFVSEPVYNAVHRMVLARDGILFRGRRADDEAGREFLASRDPWFRPTEIRTGPDGALWIADMYRFVLEHPEWIPEGLQATLDLKAGDDRGRVYRVFPRTAPPRPLPRLAEFDTAGLVAALESPNGWTRDRAQRRLVEAADPTAIPLLRSLATGSPEPRARIHARYALAALGALTAGDVRAALEDPHPEGRRHALRLAEKVLPASPAALATILEGEAGASPLAFQVILSASAWEDDSVADEAIADAAARFGEDPLFGAAILTACRSEARAGRLLARIMERSAPAPQPLVVDLAAAAPAGALANAWDGLRRSVDEAGGVPGSDQLELAAVLLARLADRAEAPPAWRKAASVELEDGLAGADSRARAARFLTAAKRFAPVVATLAAPETPAPLRTELASVLGEHHDPSIAREACDALPKAPLAARNAISRLLVQRPEWAAALLATLENDRTLARGLAPDVVDRLVGHLDRGLADRARRLLASTATGDRAEALARLRPAVGLEGDVGAGATHYRERCAACHDPNPSGQRIGPDLGSVADASAEELLVAIVDPNRAIEESFLQQLVRTTDGRALVGVVVEQSGAGLTLASPDGAVATLGADEVASTETLETSLMPPGLEAGLSPKAMADLIAFLRTRAPAPKSFPGNEPRPIAIDGDEGAEVVLAASTAAIHGPSLVYESRFENLGFWGSADDRAEWTIDVSRAGRFEVWAELACTPDNAWQTFVVRLGDASLSQGASNTGSWENYNRRFLGTVPLPAGRATVSVRSKGEIRGYLMDLRALHLRRIDDAG